MSPTSTTPAELRRARTGHVSARGRACSGGCSAGSATRSFPLERVRPPSRLIAPARRAPPRAARRSSRADSRVSRDRQGRSSRDGSPARGVGTAAISAAHLLIDDVTGRECCATPVGSPSPFGPSPCSPYSMAPLRTARRRYSQMGRKFASAVAHQSCVPHRDQRNPGARAACAHRRDVGARSSGLWAQRHLVVAVEDDSPTS